MEKYRPGWWRCGAYALLMTLYIWGFVDIPMVISWWFGHTVHWDFQFLVLSPLFLLAFAVFLGMARAGIALRPPPEPPRPTPWLKIIGVLLLFGAVVGVLIATTGFFLPEDVPPAHVTEARVVTGIVMGLWLPGAILGLSLVAAQQPVRKRPPQPQ